MSKVTLPSEERAAEPAAQKSLSLEEKILIDVLREWIADGEQSGQENIVVETDDGECGPVFEDEFNGGYGHFQLCYFPKDAIRGIISTCNNFLRSLEEKAQQQLEINWKEEETEKALFWLARFATKSFLDGLQRGISETIEERSSDATILAISRYFADFLAKFGGRVDARPFIRGIGQAAAARRTKRFIDLASKLPNIRVSTSKGRPRTWTQQSLRQAVEKAILQVRKKKYREPRLTDVATSLNKSYPDRMPLNAKSLGQMLKRHGIDWKELKNPHN
jgi:hypothetical protein